MSAPLYDVVIVGGSSAGLSAALTLGRARRSVLVVDGEKPRNAPASHVQNFFTRDGTAPAELRQIGRTQLEPYDVAFTTGEVTRAARQGEVFTVTLSDTSTVSAGKLLLATGVVDDLPPLRNLRELWGRAVFTCPYCHGWEVRDTPLAVIANGELGFEYTLMLYTWSRDLVLCSNGPAQFSESQRRYLTELSLRLIETPLAGFDIGEQGELESVSFTDHARLARRAVFMHPPVRLRADLAVQLGCDLSDDGVRIVVDDMGQTTVPGVYAAGDAVTPIHQVIRAAADGSKAAAMLNRALIQETHQRRQAALSI